MWLNYSNGTPINVQEWNSPSRADQRRQGASASSGRTRGRVGRNLTLNLGVRFDHNTGTLPAQSTDGGPFIAARSIDESTPIKQNLVVWRTGASYDPLADGKTAVKASYSRYGLQVGIDRVLNVNPLQSTSQTCPWTDPNRDGIAQPNEFGTGCSGFPSTTIRYAGANGPRWPYSDEVTAGVEREIIKDMRVGVMVLPPHQPRSDRHAQHRGAVERRTCRSLSTCRTARTGRRPRRSTTCCRPSTAVQGNIVDNDPYLDTTYNGVEFTAQQALLAAVADGGGLHRRQEHRRPALAQRGRRSVGDGSDLNDPNLTLYPNGIIGNDSPVAFRLSGSYRAPYEIQIAGSLVSNTGYPFVSTYSVTRARRPPRGVALTRASQTVFLSDRGDERLPAVTLIDLRISRSFRFGNRRIEPTFDIFNLGNASTVTSAEQRRRLTYLVPNGIVSPRIMKVGFVGELLTRARQQGSKAGKKGS